MLDMKRLRMPSCQQVSQLVSQQHDRALSFLERLSIFSHVWMCRYCSRFARHLRFMRAAIERDKSATSN